MVFGVGLSVNKIALHFVTPLSDDPVQMTSPPIIFIPNVDLWTVVCTKSVCRLETRQTTWTILTTKPDDKIRWNKIKERRKRVENQTKTNTSTTTGQFEGGTFERQKSKNHLTNYKMSDDEPAVTSANRKRPNVLITGTPGVGKSE